MKLFRYILPAILPALSLMACSRSVDAQTANNSNNTMTEQTADTTSVRVAVRTTAGNFTVLLYGDTPKHRDNFVKLVNEGYYDNTLFHRVIKDFMIQAGDPDSKTAQPGQALGAGGPGYKIDAEIVYPRHFHKRGALAAARQGDQVNPMKQSSGSQFYIVTGRKSSEAEMKQMAQHLKNNQMQAIFNRLALAHRDAIIEMQRKGDRAGLQALQDTLIKQTEAEAAAAPAPEITPEMKQAYTTVGGAPHLDGEYTVFGEVVEGMETIDRIEKAETDGRDRPSQDIRILSMKIEK
ncbi:MAG: peptidylprolyl isomerase [Muribaculaceae bacterium]|nr:peptidylprolyl isomerase [Muribaculaceae bacterium]MDE6196271.1 peptidylprolyl isomerase [Muribaculaceae bacterium]